MKVYNLVIIINGSEVQVLSFANQDEAYKYGNLINTRWKDIVDGKVEGIKLTSTSKKITEVICECVVNELIGFKEQDSHKFEPSVNTKDTSIPIIQQQPLPYGFGYSFPKGYPFNPR